MCISPLAATGGQRTGFTGKAFHTYGRVPYTLLLHDLISCNLLSDNSHIYSAQVIEYRYTHTMKLLRVLLGLLGVAIASIYEEWHPAGPDDVRSPCPALNSLANVPTTFPKASKTH
ncbi:hypothetical protein T440DRAFT_15076 [Plenodomus tracheiphilus IPT5]|uniref:Heme haloperoxidase family profile domain-containing protein n=1 Tax=Plenodomus tracheiphilus IPT5 TaxID=1408161 RepID=A0A6A7BNG0_9PLEO|nr:hypothetical protein T440DRAFT_15076 [Plenodomus tracheiphilus IPT5]